MAADAAQVDWVARVLGYVVPAPTVRGPAKLTPVWNEAKEGVDRALNTLCTAVREVEHPLAQILVDRGLSGFTGRLTAPLTAALLSADTDPASASTLRPRLHDMRTFLSSNRVIGLIEDNPFGVTVAIRAPLIAALDEIEAALPH
jgi:hypothetical protein